MIYRMDAWLLVAAKSVVDFAMEWFSIKQRWLERGMMVVYVGLRFTHMALNRLPHWMGVDVVIGLIILLNAHRYSDAERVWRLVWGQGVSFRAWFVLSGPMLAAIQLIPPVRPGDLVAIAQLCFFPASLYVMALPQSGQRGKRRKAAITKIVDSFGRTWSPEPVPQGSGA